MKVTSIKKRKTFVHMSKKAEVIATKGVVLQALHRSESTSLKLGVTATKKLGCAVVRNKVKRRLRHAFSEAIKQKDIKGYDFVAIGRYYTANRDFEKLVVDFKYALKQVTKNN